jgi:hypothetical protein
VAAENFWTRFRGWRRDRPFWGGLFLILSGLEMFLSANMALDNIEIHIGPQGFLSYLIPTLLLVAGALVWFSPAQRLFYGVIGTLTALYSFIGLNLGGWFVGMLLGIVGGALAIAWSPPARPSGSKDLYGTDDELAEADEPAGGFPPVVSDPSIVPGIEGAGPGIEGAGPGAEPRRHPAHRRPLLAIVPLLLAVTVVVAGPNRPADAAPECPEGMPSRTATPSPSPSTAARTKAAETKASEAKAAKKRTTPAPKSPSANPSPAPDGGRAADDEEDQGTGIPILDGIGDALEDIGDGLNDILNPGEETPTPAPTATSAPAPTPSAPVTSRAGAPAAPKPSTGSSTGPSGKPEEIPCLGARQEGLVAEPGAIPRAGVKPGILKTRSLTMYNSTYEGVVDVPTANGPVKSLFFSMDKAVNKPFSLEIAEAGGATTMIRSGELTTDGNVEFYSPRFVGKLFGLIPVTFTPEQPPPLTLPVLWFTDVTIDLAYVQCDVLTAKPISISELS